MSEANPTDEEETALWSPCDRCGAKPGFWCRTRSGLRATQLHSCRVWAYQEGYGAGYQDSEADHINYVRSLGEEKAIAYVRRLLEGKRW